MLKREKSVFPNFAKHEEYECQEFKEGKDASNAPFSLIVKHAVGVAYGEEIDHHIYIKDGQNDAGTIKCYEAIFHQLLKFQGLFVI